MGTKTRTKLYSTLLSVMMLVNLVPTPALAEGEPQPTETPVIVQTETPAAEPEATITEEPTPTPVTEPTVTEEVPVIPVEGNTEPASTETPAPEQTPVSEQEETPVPEQEEKQDEESKETEADSEEDTEESEETELEETEDEEVSYPAVTLSETVDGVTVTLTAPEGSLPEGVHMTVEPVHEEAIFEAVDGTLAEEGRELASAVAFDITLYDAKENELQPNKYVTVSFSNTNLSSIGDNSTIDVYRVSDDASEVTPVTTIAATDNNQMFITDHFTIYLASSNIKTDIKGNTADPNGDGSYKPNEQYHRYYLDFGEIITLESDEGSSIFTDEWSIYGCTYQGAITQLDSNRFQNTNVLESYEIATIEHKYGFLGRNVEYFFVSLRPQTTYNVVFNFCDAGKNEFQTISTQVIKKNFDAVLPDTPPFKNIGNKTYVFSGWCSDQECTKPIPVRDLNRVERDITAYGKYTESENFAVVFNGNADDCTYIPSTLYGSTNPVTGQPFKYAERPAYTCKGWATSLERASNGIVDYLYPYEGGFVIPEGKQVLELYAVWEETDVTLSYAPNNYSWGKVSRSYEYVKAINGIAQGATATAKDGYRFVKWTDNKGNVLSTEPTFIPQKTDEGYYVYVRHTAVFEPISYTVTFNTNGGSTIDPQTVVKGEKAERPSTNPTKGEGTCFEFNNWYADANLSTVFDFNQPITADTTVYAGWKSGNHNFDDEHMEAWENPTCTEDGHKGGYECLNCHKHFTDKTGQTEITDWVIPALGHDWEISYDWNDDYTSINATRICKNNSAHNTEESGNVSHYHRDPTCTEKGRDIYVATFTNDFFQTQVKEIEGTSALGHSWGAPAYTWDDDHSRVIAVVHCTRNPAHVEAESVNTAMTPITATCTESGTAKYVAEFTNNKFVKQEQTFDVPALGHDWADPSFTWESDNSSVTARHVCTRDKSHFEKETVTTTHYELPATCTTPSTIVYTAAFSNPEFGVQRKNVEGSVPALGHEWGEWEVVKDPTAVEEGLKQRFCAHDKSHVETEALPKVTYSVKTGDGQTWTKGSDVTADFEFERSEENEAKKLTAYDLFTEVLIDGKKVTDFTKEKGSVITKIYASYLETLSAGDHKITAKFSDGGSVTASFTVKDKEPAPTPDEKKSSGGSSTPAAPVDNVVTCQMAGYPANYSWNEAAKACQPGYIDAAGNFHPYSTRERAVPNTYDQGLAVHTWILGISALTAVFCALTLRRDSLY